MDLDRYEQERKKANLSNYMDSKSRVEPVLLEDIKKRNVISTLEKYLLVWPPCDVRCEMSYQVGHDFRSTDSAFMEDLSDGIILQVMDRDPIHCGIVLGVYLQSNLAEFERYNQVVDKHNQAWINQGCPEDTFNPITGDMAEIKDQLVSYAETKNPRIKRPRRIKNNGPLEKAKPDVKRNLYAQIEFRLSFSSKNEFVLSFVAKDYNSQIIYYNILVNKDLAYLTRRAIQELFGNPFVYGNSGALLDGIAFLIQGKKLPICAKESKRPDWLEGSFKTRNQGLNVARIESIWYKLLGCIFGILVPVLLFWDGVLVTSYQSLVSFDKTMQGDRSWFIRVISSCILIVISFLIAKRFFRKSNVFKLQSNIL